jgi:RNA polymerase sigma factor (sigma-70 family)
MTTNDHPIDGSGLPLDRMLSDHMPALRDYIRRRSGELVASRESASDLAQSVCREVVEHIDRFHHGDDDGFRRWLFRTAERKIINRYRYYTAEKRDVGREVAEADGYTPAHLFVTPSRDAMAREELERAQAAFEALPRRYQRAILLAKVEGRCHADIARVMDTTEGAARNLVYRGLAAISRQLDGG